MPFTQASSGSNPESLRHIEAQDTGFYIHPDLVSDNDSCKGRLYRVSSAVPSDTILLVDISYATVPAVEPSGKDALICSNLMCSRRVTQDELATRCTENCFKDVAWCDATCRAGDIARHAFECSWLKEMGETVRRLEGEYNFVTLWHLVRLLAGRSLEMASDLWEPSRHSPRKGGWESVEACCSYLDSWPESQIEHWKRLIEKYLSNASTLPSSINSGKMLSLICKEETNTFSLYGKITGPMRVSNCLVPRGEPYGLSLYPRAALFNHSCIPNVSHKPDGRGRMVYTTARDIAEDEECVITYFDLTAFDNLGARQKQTREQFQFACTCERCLEEAARENLVVMDSLPFSNV